MSKDDRMFVPIKDKQMQHHIRTVMKTTGITYEQLMAKYLRLPCSGDLELLENKHNETKKLYEEYVCIENKEQTHELFSYIWAILAQTALGNSESQKIIKILKDCLTDTKEQPNND